MVSSTNVEVVAANNVALQHYGQQVVCGHVMANSGRRILIQITFDVMNVREPLSGTSALKHRGVTFSITTMTATFSKRDSEFVIPRLSFLHTHQSGEWNPALQGKRW